MKEVLFIVRLRKLYSNFINWIAGNEVDYFGDNSILSKRDKPQLPVELWSGVIQYISKFSVINQCFRKKTKTVSPKVDSC